MAVVGANVDDFLDIAGRNADLGTSTRQGGRPFANLFLDLRQERVTLDKGLFQPSPPWDRFVSTIARLRYLTLAQLSTFVNLCFRQKSAINRATLVFIVAYIA